MRTYETTHPWLRFSVDLSKAPTNLWVMLGECQSKCEHLSRVPLRPDTAKELCQVYLAKGIQATTAIEGNTLSEEQVLQHIRGNLKLAPSKEYLQREINNILQACNETTQMVVEGSKPPVSVERLKHLNGQVLNQLDVEEGVVPGQIRTHSVVVGNAYRGAPAEDCEYLVDRLSDWLNGPDFVPSDSMKESGVVFAILRAVLAHLYLAWIHPFGDGNGRTARLVEFEILVSSGLPIPVTNLLSSHYNLTRSKYYQQLAEASRSGGDVIPFILYAVEGFLDGLREYIERVWNQQYDVAWRSYVHEAFRDDTGEAHVGGWTAGSRLRDRRRRLVLDLSSQEKAVSRAQIAQVSPRIATAYARKTDMTLTRDLNELLRMGLIVKEHGAYRARKEIILGFLPVKAAVIPSGANAADKTEE